MTFSYHTLLRKESDAGEEVTGNEQGTCVFHTHPRSRGLVIETGTSEDLGYACGEGCGAYRRVMDSDVSYPCTRADLSFFEV